MDFTYWLAIWVFGWYLDLFLALVSWIYDASAQLLQKVQVFDFVEMCDSTM